MGEVMTFAQYTSLQLYKQSFTRTSFSNRVLRAIMAAELEATLTVLGLEQYLPRFLDFGFGDWEALTRIAETQLSLLDVRLGHRRRLQRAIAKDRSSWPDNAPLPLAPDLNQRVQDWLHQETRSDPCAVTSEYQPPSSS